MFLEQIHTAKSWSVCWSHHCTLTAIYPNLSGMFASSPNLPKVPAQDSLVTRGIYLHCTMCIHWAVPLYIKENGANRAIHKATSITDQGGLTRRLMQLQEDSASLVNKVELVRGLLKSWVVQDSTSCQRECTRWVSSASSLQKLHGFILHPYARSLLMSIMMTLWQLGLLWVLRGYTRWVSSGSKMEHRWAAEKYTKCVIYLKRAFWLVHKLKGRPGTHSAHTNVNMSMAKIRQTFQPDLTRPLQVRPGTDGWQAW
jgi:hypothetical protein